MPKFKFVCLSVQPWEWDGRTDTQTHRQWQNYYTRHVRDMGVKRGCHFINLPLTIDCKKGRERREWNKARLKPIAMCRSAREFEADTFSISKVSLFRKGSFRAGAKRRFEHCPFFCSFVRSCLVWHLLLTGLSAVSCPLVYNLLICSSSVPHQKKFRVILPVAVLVIWKPDAVQSGNCIVWQSLCETSCPPRTVHWYRHSLLIVRDSGWEYCRSWYWGWSPGQHNAVFCFRLYTIFISFQLRSFFRYFPC